MAKAGTRAVMIPAVQQTIKGIRRAQISEIPAPMSRPLVMEVQNTRALEITYIRLLMVYRNTRRLGSATISAWRAE